jgi:hypothetical protein
MRSNRLPVPKELYIVNVGIKLFYDEAVTQKIEVVHVSWQPPHYIEKDIETILDRIGE